MMADDQGQLPFPYGPEPSGPQQPYYRRPLYGQPLYGQPQSGPAPYGQPQPVWWAPQAAAPVPAAPHRRHHRTLVAIAAGAAGVMLAGGFTAVALDHSTAGSSPSASSLPSQGNSGSGSGLPSWYGNGNSGGSGTGTTSQSQASASQSVGVVDINTVIDYGAAQAAGTGIVLTSNGEILTNNHVINGSTSIKVTVVSTGKTYTATVVGDDPTDDVAVLQLSGASGLATAKLGDSSNVAVGNTVTAVGNAGGTGGTPSSATGTVTALNQSITASDEGGGNPEKLTGMIEIDANIQAGDSGGPLYASNGSIIGIDTAASSQSFNSSTTGFAIPINKALSIAKQIESGHATDTVHIGAQAFLGVELASSSGNGFGFNGSAASSGAAVSGVVSGSAADQAGLQAGDTVTSVNGQNVSDASALSTIMAGFKPGQQVTIGWVDSSGQSHSATVTLGSGPAA